MTEGQLTKLRIEYVKNQILKKLRLTERPNVSATNLPRPIAEGSMINDEDEEEQQQNKAFEQYYGKTTQKIIFLELGMYEFWTEKYQKRIIVGRCSFPFFLRLLIYSPICV